MKSGVIYGIMLLLCEGVYMGSVDKNTFYDLMNYLAVHQREGTYPRIVEDRKGNTCIAYEEECYREDDKNFSLYIIGKYGNKFQKIGNTYSCLLDPNKLMLDAIYVDKKQRGASVGDALYDLTEICATRNHDIRSIVGTFCPYDMQGEESANELDSVLHKRARGLYKKKGFEIITIADYLSDKYKYPYAKEADFFDRSVGLDEDTLIIYKPMTKKTFDEYGLHLSRDGILVPKKLMHKYSKVISM